MGVQGFGQMRAQIAQEFWASGDDDAVMLGRRPFCRQGINHFMNVVVRVCTRLMGGDQRPIGLMGVNQTKRFFRRDQI